MKCVTQLLLIALVFGVYSVSSHSAYAYPASRSSYSGLESDSIQLTRSSRDSNDSSSSSKRYVSSDTAPLSPGTNNLSIGVGQIFLMGNLSNSYENALGTQIHYTYGVSDMFCFESDFGYSSHSNGNFSLVSLDAGLRTNLVYFDKLIPFANVGLGFYHPSGIIPDSNVSLSALLFGMELGGGVDLLLSKKIFFGTRLSFHDMFDSTTQASNGKPYAVGGSYLSFMIDAGVTF